MAFTYKCVFSPTNKIAELLAVIRSQPMHLISIDKTPVTNDA